MDFSSRWHLCCYRLSVFPIPFFLSFILIHVVTLILSGNLNSHKIVASFAIQNSFSAGPCWGSICRSPGFENGIMNFGFLCFISTTQIIFSDV
jgi:hypothetical protein